MGFEACRNKGLRLAVSKPLFSQGLLTPGSPGEVAVVVVSSGEEPPHIQRLSLTFFSHSFAPYIQMAYSFPLGCPGHP